MFEEEQNCGEVKELKRWSARALTDHPTGQHILWIRHIFLLMVSNAAYTVVKCSLKSIKRTCKWILKYLKFFLTFKDVRVSLKLKLSHAATSLLIKDNNIDNVNHFFILNDLQNQVYCA